MTERQERQADPDPGPIEHTDAERVTGPEAEPDGQDAEQERQDEDAAASD